MQGVLERIIFRSKFKLCMINIRHYYYHYFELLKSRRQENKNNIL